MKRIAVLAVLLLAVTQIQAQSQPAAKPVDAAPATVKPADPKAVPAAKAVVKKEPEPIIPGLTIPRGNGTFLGLEVAGGNFKLSFYDKKKKPVAPDVSRATARWPNLKSVTGPNRTVLIQSGAVRRADGKEWDAVLLQRLYQPDAGRRRRRQGGGDLRRPVPRVNRDARLLCPAYWTDSRSPK